jgi:chromosome segregation ATPase
LGGGSDPTPSQKQRQFPSPGVLSRAHQALHETEAAILREWEALETEHQRLSDWCT